MSRTPRGLALLACLSLSACGGAEPSSGDPPKPSSPTPAPSSTPAPDTTTPESSAPTEPPTPTEAPAPDIGATRLELGWAYQLSTTKDRAKADAAREQVERALASNSAVARPYLLRREQFYLVMAGSFASEAEAQPHLAAAKAALGQGGFIRAMREFCPGQRHDEEHLYTCVEVELPEPGEDPEALADEFAEPAPEPYTYPEQSNPDPVAIAHPAAAQIMIIASNRGYTPGEAGVDRDAKFRTFIWRPALGPLPEKGKAPEAPESESDEAREGGGETGSEVPSGGPMLVEINKVLLVSDGHTMWQVGVEQEDVKLPQCDCGVPWGEDPVTNKKLAKRLVELRARPLAGGAETTLIDVLDFPHSGAAECIYDRNEVDHVIQIHAVAGDRVLVVERSVDTPPCWDPDEPGFDEGYVADTRRQRVFDLGLGRALTLAELEAELPYALVKDARFASSKKLSDESSPAGYAALAPTALELTGVFPRYREWKGGVRLLLQYGVELPGEGTIGGWGTDYDAHVVTQKFPPSSSLTMPAAVEPLMLYVQREYKSWKVIGWSLHELDAGPPAPAPPPPP